VHAIPRKTKPYTHIRHPAGFTTLIVVLLVLVSLPLSGCQVISDLSATPTPAPRPASGLPAWLKIYFTNPNPPDNLPAGIDQPVVALLNQAQQSIDLASFDFNLPDVTQALQAASNRQVRVRVVLDEVNGSHELPASQASDQQPFDALSALTGAGIPVVDGGRSNGLMHDKFIIIDHQVLLVGSWNMSYNDTFRNNNNLLQISDPGLIANYQAKFDELFVDQRFGTKAEIKAQTPVLIIGGVPVENYFSPPDEVMDKLVSYVSGARQSIHFMAFTYTHPDLSDAMIARARAGVDVQGVIENRGASQGALVPLFCAGLAVKTDGNKYTMHHKVIILDGNTVITGSFNFTKAADTVNDDNILVIHDANVAALYEQEFSRIEASAKTPSKADIDCSQVK
jgi:phosphatidylserine/phosphatidylglycerophosphate/cardiolipin synthase-like enzyme